MHISILEWPSAIAKAALSVEAGHEAFRSSDPPSSCIIEPIAVVTAYSSA